MKIVHEEWHKELLVLVKAKYFDDYSIKVDGEWHKGRVVLKCEIYNRVGDVVREFDDGLGMWSSGGKFSITFKRKYNRQGFLKLKRIVSIEHISDEYDRVLPLFIEESLEIAEGYVEKEYRNKNNKLVTDGLPDSLKGL